MELTRRDFFGVIAAPLYRKLLPIVPLATGGVVPLVALTPRSSCFLSIRGPDGEWHRAAKVLSITITGTSDAIASEPLQPGRVIITGTSDAIASEPLQPGRVMYWDR